MFDSFYAWGERALGIPGVALRDLLYTAVALILWIVLRRAVVRPLSRRFDDTERRYIAQKTGSAALTLVLVLFLVAVWFGSYGPSVLDFAAIFAAGLAIALKEPISSLAGWLYVMLRRPFGLQDRIEVRDMVIGDVVDQSMFRFSVLEVGGWVDAEQSTGRIVHVPNNVVFTHAIANHTQGFEYVWNEMPITVTFDSDWRRAHTILTNLGMELTADMHDGAKHQMEESSTQFMVHYTQLNAIVWIRVVDIGVRLTLRYLCAARARRVTESQIWERILDAFNAEPDVEFATPVQRFFPGDGPPPTGP